MSIKVAVVGVGNCAKSLIEGVSFYKGDTSDQINGLMLAEIGGYRAGDIEFVAAFDVDKRKVGLTLDSAIKQKPNCAIELKDDVSDVTGDVRVSPGPVLDGVGAMSKTYPVDETFLPHSVNKHIDGWKEQIVGELRDSGADVLINYLPVGSQEATEFYMECALEAGVSVVNCIPVFIASDPKWEQRFIDAGLAIVGDDMRSQFGASIVSSVLQELLFMRGHNVTMHYQDNVGGNTDFMNMQDPARLASKKISKENVIKKQNELHNREVKENSIHAGPAQYFNALGDNKRASWLIKAEGFGGSPIEFTADLSVQDSPNSAGVVIDALRLIKVAQELGVVGALHGASAFTQKTPPQDMSTNMAYNECVMLAKRELTPFTSRQLKENKPDALELQSYFKKLVSN